MKDEIKYWLIWTKDFWQRLVFTCFRSANLTLYTHRHHLDVFLWETYTRAFESQFNLCIHIFFFWAVRLLIWRTQMLSLPEPFSRANFYLPSFGAKVFYPSRTTFQWALSAHVCVSILTEGRCFVRGLARISFANESRVVSCALGAERTRHRKIDRASGQICPYSFRSQRETFAASLSHLRRKHLRRKTHSTIIQRVW